MCCPFGRKNNFIPSTCLVSRPTDQWCYYVCKSHLYAFQVICQCPSFFFFFSGEREKKLKAKSHVLGEGLWGESLQPNRCLSSKWCVSWNTLPAPSLCVLQKQAWLLNQVGVESERNSSVLALLVSCQTDGELLKGSEPLFSHLWRGDGDALCSSNDGKGDDIHTSVTSDSLGCSPPVPSVHGEFSRQEYWNGLSFPPGIFLTQKSNPHLPRLLHWQVDFFLLVPKMLVKIKWHQKVQRAGSRALSVRNASSAPLTVHWQLPPYPTSWCLKLSFCPFTVGDKPGGTEIVSPPFVFSQNLAEFVCLFVLKKHLEFTCYSAHSWHLWEGCVWETVCVYACVCVLRWTSSVSYKHFCRWMNCCPGGWVTCLQTLLKWKPQLGCESRCSYLRSCHFMLREPGIFLAILWHCRAEIS